MNGIDALVLPSRTVPTWKEQFGRVIIEAHACGTPVIGSDSGAIPEVVGEGGVIFAEGNVAQLAETIASLAASPELIHKLGHTGKEQVHERYTWQKVAEQMYNVYQSVNRVPRFL
jgi:glycosyltransferase involved in cell wall biosynthesis